MEKKVNNDSRVLEGAYNILEQINSLLVSAANPSDETSLSIRLSLIKVCSYIYKRAKDFHESTGVYTILIFTYDT